MTGPALLGAAEIRRLAAQLQIRPSKTLGQNFVVDANTVRRIVRTARPGRPIARRNRARLTRPAVRRPVTSVTEPSAVSAVDNTTVTGTPTPPDQAPGVGS